MFIQWTEAYEMGIPEVDADHRQLIASLNHFFARAQAGASAKDLGAILNRLVDQVAQHFEHEEMLLARTGYPDIAKHAAEHHRLLEQIRRFKQPFDDNSAARDLTMDTGEFLRHWVLGHIVEEDVPCRVYLLQKLA